MFPKTPCWTVEQMKNRKEKKDNGAKKSLQVRYPLPTLYAPPARKGGWVAPRLSTTLSPIPEFLGSLSRLQERRGREPAGRVYPLCFLTYHVFLCFESLSLYAAPL